jgi:hypothetical protein
MTYGIQYSATGGNALDNRKQRENRKTRRKMETINESKLWYAVVEDTACININISTKDSIIDQHRLTYLSRSIRRLCLLQCAVVTARLPLLVV